MKKKILLLPLLSLTLSGCSFEDLMFWKKKDQDTDQKDTSKEDEEKTEPEEQKNYKTCTIKTYGEEFDEIFNDGGKISDKIDQFTTYLQNQSSTYNSISTFEVNNLFAREWNNDLYLQFGSGSNAIGELNIVFSSNVYKVEAKVLCYSKTFIPAGQTDPITNVDSWSHFSINGKDNELSYDEEKGIEIFTFENEINSGTKTISLASSMGRVLMTEFTVYYL